MMRKETVRNSGIDSAGSVSWGTHFCQLYNTKQDLVDIIIPYLKAGLENNEFCIWIASNPLEARKTFRQLIPDHEIYIEKKQIEFFHHNEWFLKGGVFDPHRTLSVLVEKFNTAQASNYDGLRLSEGIFSLEAEYRDDFAEYEREIDRIIGSYQMIALCVYPFNRYTTAEIYNIMSNHQFALVKKEGKWERIKSSR